MGKGKKEKAEPVSPRVVTEMLSASVLQEMVNSLEQNKLDLLNQMDEQDNKLERQKRDQEDIYYYLNKKCDESFEVITSLEDQIANEQSDRETAEKLYESKIEDMKVTAENNTSRLNSKISDLETKLEMLNSFAEAKGSLEGNLEDLTVTLAQERQAFKVNVNTIENKFLMEREKIKKGFDHKYTKMKKEEEAKLDSLLSKKSKTISTSNFMMKKELDDQSRHAEKLLEINSKISNRDRDLQIEVQLSNTMITEMEHSLTMAQRLIKQQNESIKALDSKLASTEKRCADQEHKHNAERIQLQAKLEQARRKKLNDRDQKREDMLRFASNVLHDMKAALDRRGQGVKISAPPVPLSSAQTIATLSTMAGSVASSSSSSSSSASSTTDTDIITLRPANISVDQDGSREGKDNIEEQLDRVETSPQTQETTVIRLVQAILNKYPKLIMVPAVDTAGQQMKKQSRQSASRGSTARSKDHSEDVTKAPWNAGFNDADSFNDSQTKEGDFGATQTSICESSAMDDLVSMNFDDNAQVLTTQRTNFPPETGLASSRAVPNLWDLKSSTKKRRIGGLKRSVHTQTSEDDLRSRSNTRAGVMSRTIPESPGLASSITNLQTTSQLKKYLTGNSLSVDSRPYSRSLGTLGDDDVSSLNQHDGPKKGSKSMTSLKDERLGRAKERDEGPYEGRDRSPDSVGSTTSQTRYSHSRIDMDSVNSYVSYRQRQPGFTKEPLQHNQPTTVNAADIISIQGQKMSVPPSVHLPKIV